MGRDERFNPNARHTLVQAPSIIRDAYGRSLDEGDQIQLYPPVPPLYRVTAIRPCVDPRLPPNLMEIELQTVMIFRADRNVANKEFVRVITAEEAQQKGAGPRSPDVPAPPPPAARLEVVAPLLPPDSPVSDQADGASGDPEPQGEPI